MAGLNSNREQSDYNTSERLAGNEGQIRGSQTRRRSPPVPKADAGPAGPK